VSEELVEMRSYGTVSAPAPLAKNKLERERRRYKQLLFLFLFSLSLLHTVTTSLSSSVHCTELYIHIRRIHRPFAELRLHHHKSLKNKRTKEEENGSVLDF
jgi:hypothetical protein